VASPEFLQRVNTDIGKALQKSEPDELECIELIIPIATGGAAVLCLEITKILRRVSRAPRWGGRVLVNYLQVIAGSRRRQASIIYWPSTCGITLYHARRNLIPSVLSRRPVGLTMKWEQCWSTRAKPSRCCDSQNTLAQPTPAFAACPNLAPRASADYVIASIRHCLDYEHSKISPRRTCRAPYLVVIPSLASRTPRMV